MAKSAEGPAHYRDPHQDVFTRIADRRRRRLILPSLLARDAQDMRLETPERDAAFELIGQWWQQALAGRLNRKETSIDDLFLSEVFGKALGYRGVTDSTDRYERERQFTVPNVGPCDGALGLFPPAQPENVRAVIELKDAQTHLDRTQHGKRSPAQQMWDYLNAMPETCVWGILSNLTTIRLYHRSKGSQVYEQYTLRELAEDRQAFNRFYLTFEIGGLLKGILDRPPRAIRLLDQTSEGQRQVGDQLYEYYSDYRAKLIQFLHKSKKLDIDTAIKVSQKLIDRVLFIAFCEDRGLIDGKTIDKAYKGIQAFSRIRNPIWQNFLGLFHAMDKGSPIIALPNGYNGGLFREDELLDGLDLDDVPWTNFFHGISRYDFAHQVNVDVLGHLFEKSVTELERLREGALLAEQEDNGEGAMQRSPQRRLFGIYYTPVEFTTAIVQYTVDEIVAERFQAVRDAHRLTEEKLRRESREARKAAKAYWHACLRALRTITICDPACGSGAFLIQAYEAIFQHYSLVITELANLGDKQADTLFDEIPDLILAHNLFGVDLQPEAVEIAQLALWLRTARNGKTLADLSRNILCGNSLADDPTVHPRAFKWPEAFPAIFSGDRPGFDCVIGNPPWERLKLQEREFFALSEPRIAAAVNAADRQRMIDSLQTSNPELHQQYLRAQANADRMLDYARTSGRYPLTGKGDINTYMLFAELALSLVAPHGRVGLLVPSGIATDKTTAEFFNTLMDTKTLRRFYDFENKRGVFADVHRSFKFSILNIGGREVTMDAADFVFYAHGMDEVEQPRRHIALSAADMKLLNPNTCTCPVFRDRRSAEITKAVYRRVPVLIDRNRRSGGNPWNIRFVRMFDQTNDAKWFTLPAKLKEQRYRLDGNRWVKGKHAYLPLYEAKMVQAYDHRAASIEIEPGNWMRQGQTVDTTPVEHQNPEHRAMPRWWVDADQVKEALGSDLPPVMLGFKDITSPTNQRTMIASWIPCAAVTNHFPIMRSSLPLKRLCCLLGNLNSHVFDFITRQKIGGITLNFFIVEQLPTLPPDAYDEKCPWQKRGTLESWIAERVLKLSCTADDMRPLAEACGFEPPVHKWKPAEREQLLAELDAAYFILYGIERDDVLYILSTFQRLRGEEDAELLTPSQEPGLSDAGSRIIGAYDALRSRC